MSNLPLERFLDLPPDASARGFVLRYGYQRGMMLIYRSQVAIYRDGDGGAAQAEELEARLRVKIIDIDESDSGARLVVYYEPRWHRIGIRDVAPAAPSIIYVKQNEFGEPIESTEPSGGVNLLLPRMGVSLGTTWREIERYAPPGGGAPIEIVRHYRIARTARDHVVITFQADELGYGAGHDSTQTLGGHGEYTFDTTYGVITKQVVETSMKARQGERWSEVRSVYAMELVDE